MDHGGSGDGVLALVMLALSRELVLGKESLSDPFEIDRIGRVGPGLIESIGSKFEQFLGGKGVVLNAQFPQPLEDRIEVLVRDKTAQGDSYAISSILWGGLLSRRHLPNPKSKCSTLQKSTLNG
jgi:hypothetical protein